jgi:mRNA interferase RelE/StbE
MSPYRVNFNRRAERELSRQPRAVADRIIEVATILEKEPVPWKTHDVARIKGREDTYRIRLGDLRIIYKINRRLNEVTIQRIAPRGDAYKGTD